MKSSQILIVVFLLVQGAAAQRQAASAGAGDWPMYRHDYAGTGASTLAEINAGNVAKLTRVWTYALQGESGPPPNSEATPIVVNGVMYLPASGRVVALDPEKGTELWRYAVTGGAPSRRGVAYWPGDGTLPARIIFTAGRRLIALDAKTGQPDRQFGTNGEVDMVVPYNSVPLVYRNIVVVGANTPQGAQGGIGNPRAFDARTGAKLWEFSSVAQPGDPGHDTWDGDSWKGRLGVNAWPFYFTVDEQRGLLFVPLASPIPDEYGGDRKGANLYGNSVVAVDAATGKYKWHFQTIHHDLWDADPPAPPALFDAVQNGRRVPALGVTTKSGYLYILNRETGKPLFGVEERPVAKSDVPGEVTYPTQPIPVKPPPIARTSYTAADLVTAADTTPEHAAACSALVEKLGGVANAGPFTPWGYRTEGAKTPTTLVFPGGLGGANWGGLAYDARSGNLIVASQDVGALGWMVKKPDGSFDKATPERSGSARGAFDVRLGAATLPLPCQKPPWGRLIAVNGATGNVSWQVPLGVSDELPEAKQRTGRPPLAGAIVTGSGLLFIASTDDNRFRALEATSGKELWMTRLDKRGNADPMTFQARNGKQYVAIVATDTVAVYALP
jgi:quinoprotein glucose dehydrogenase